MSSDPEATHLSPTNIVVALRDVCALLYPEERDTRVVVADAGLETSRIDFSSRAETNWHNIWLEAIRQNQVDALLTVLVGRYPTNLSLQAAVVGYQRFLAAGGRLDARTLLTLTTTDDAPAPGDPPYQGMAYYDVADADRFFGREALTAELVDHLRQQPLLAVVGASGSGKSSLVRSGVIPALQGKKPLTDGKQPPTGSARWAYHLITPTARPLESLAASLTRSSESVTATGTLIDDLRRDHRSLHLYARRLVSGEQRLVLLVDQFEELFTLCKERAERQAFVENLLYAVQPDGVVTLLLTLRADFYHHCADFPALRTALETQQRYIGAMTSDELRRAIEEPAHAAHWSFQPGLVEQLLHDVGDEPGALPLLSHALLETWQRRHGRTLMLAGYRAAGGVQGAIAKTADDVFNRFTGEQKNIARILFLRLTELGEGVQDTRRRVRPAELKLTQANPDAVQQVLKTLADARLVTTDEDEVQVAHEALIRHWATLRAWLDDDREGHRIQRRLTEAANQWVEFGKEPALLYRGVLLQQAQDWLKETFDSPNQIEIVFLQASQTEVEAEERRKAEMAAEREASRQRELENQRQRARIFRNAVVISSLLLLIALGLAEWGRRSSRTASNNAVTAKIALATSDASVIEVSKERDRANQQANIAARSETEAIVAQANAEQQATIAKQQADFAFSRQLAAQSTSELSKGQYEPAILLAVSSGQVTDTLEAFSAIRAAIANSWHSRLVFYGHESSVTQASWNHDESKILTSSADGTARIWDTVMGKELARLQGHTDNVTQASWNHDESKILTSSFDKTARVWDTATGKELFRLEGHTDFITQASWNHDESKILTRSADGTARIWDASTGEELLSLEGHTDFITQASWNHDESKILTSSADGTARIWDTAMGKELARLHGVTLASWNQDGSKILTRNVDQFGIASNVRIWDADTGRVLIKFEGHTNFITQASWNHDESKILTGSADNTVRIWDVATGEELVRLQGHRDSIVQASWSQDESKILTSSFDGTARIWDAATGEELARLQGHTDSITQASWNQDESNILTSSFDGTARIWDAVTDQELVELVGHTDSITQASWNQDESKILTSSLDRTARIWDASTGEELLSIEGHIGYVYQASWNRDGSKVLTSSGHLFGNDNTARIWDAVTGKELVRLDGGTGEILQATWNQDENKILTRSSEPLGTDNAVRIWDAATGRELLKLEGYTDQASWNHDESKILTSSDGTAHIWDAATGKELFNLNEQTTYVSLAIWNQDGSKILTSSNIPFISNNAVLIWDVATRKEMFKLEGYTDIVYQAKWNQDASRILSCGKDGTARIWDAVTGKELLRLQGHTGSVLQASWNQDESKILTRSGDGTARIWDAATGKELVRLDGHTGSVLQASWNQDGSKILTTSNDGTVRIWYVQMSNLLVAGCRWAPRNFTWSEWNIYLADNLGSYHPICPNALIPRDAIDGIQTEARQQILAGQVLRGTQRLKDLNGWLQVNGQFGSYGVDINAFVSEVSATATAEALLMSILIPTPSVTPSPMQPASPLLSQPPSPLPSPTITPQASGTPVAPSPVVTLGRSITPPLSPP